MTTTAKLPVLTDEQIAAAETDARHRLWRAGDLSYKLDEGRTDGPQRRIYEKSQACSSKTFVTEDARRLGKTCAHVIIAFELGLKNPGRRINWCQDTAKAVRDMAKPLFEKLAKDAPADCQPVWNDHRSSMEFPNGAYIFVFGGDTQADADNARGGDDPIASFIDEGGSIALLKYIYRSVVKPGMRRIKRAGHFGMIFVASSTPEDLDHYFIELATINQAKGSYVSEDIYASSDPEQYIREEAEDFGVTVEAFKETDEFKREFLNQRIVSFGITVVPEFAAVKSNVVREWPRPIGFEQFIYKRTGIDPGGMRDPTGILAGYVDFTNAKVVIEGERLLKKPTTSDIAKAVVELETELWGEPPPADANTGAKQDRYRISRPVDDPHGRMVMDLWELHRMHAQQAVKNDRNASIALIRSWLVAGTLIILPRCVKLQHQLLTAKNNRTRTDFERTDEGHFDLVAALMYFCRELSLTTNPYPADFDKLTGRTLPDNHPLVVRQAQMGKPREVRGLAGALLSGNKFIQGQLRRRR